MQFDKRDAADVFVGGSSLLQVYLSDAEAQAVYEDASAVAAWYTISYLAGGTYGDEFTASALRDEGGTQIRNTTTQDDFVITNVVMQGDSVNMTLFDTYLTQSNHKYRYILPTNAETTPDKRQIWGLDNGLADKTNWTSDTSEGAVRGRQFVIRGTKTDTTPKRVVDEVDDIDTEAEWPVSLKRFKTDPLDWV